MSARGHAEPRNRFLSEARHHRQNAAGVGPRRHWKKVSCVVLLLGLAATAAAETSPLIAAARNSDLAAVRALVQKKADVNAAEGDGATALHWASYRDQLDIADLLIGAGREGQRGERSRRDAAVAGRSERQRGDDPPAAAGGGRSEHARSLRAKRR